MAPFEKIIADKDQITKFIPQKPPMVMVEKLIVAEGKKTISSLTILPENIFCEDGVLKEPGLIENMAQTAAAGTGYNAVLRQEEPPSGFFGGIRNLVINSLPAIGQVIRTEIIIEHEIFDALVVNGKVYLDDTMIAGCEMKIFQIKRQNDGNTY
jgi:predicted hotdog family 3-hydroxylacyl-ACP dehydratase